MARKSRKTSAGASKAVVSKPGRAGSKAVAAPAPAPLAPAGVWTFLSNHAHVLLVLAGQPDLRLRDVAAMVGITERGVQKIVADLESAGFLTHTREGRRNHYTVHTQQRLRHPVEQHRTIADLIRMVHGR